MSGSKPGANALHQDEEDKASASSPERLVETLAGTFRLYPSGCAMGLWPNSSAEQVAWQLIRIARRLADVYLPAVGAKSAWRVFRCRGACLPRAVTQ